MKKIHKVLCLFLSIVIVLSTFGVFAFAEDTKNVATADSDEYLENLSNAHKTASDGSIYHERFDSFLNVDEILALDPSTRAKMESQIVAVDEYAAGDMGFILLHYFNADELPFGGVYDPDDTMLSVVGTCYVNGEFCVIREDARYTSSIFQTFVISYSYGDYGYSVPLGNDRSYEITDIIFGNLPSIGNSYDEIFFSSKISLENEYIVCNGFGFDKKVVMFKDRNSTITEDFANADDFDWSKFPEDEEDTDLYFIQLAESTENEVFVYVYHPFRVGTRKLYATNIVLSATNGSQSAEFLEYSLKLMEEEKTICKYVVEGLVPPSGDVRYYDISSISRKVDSTFDKIVLPWQTHKAYDVEEEWKVEDTDDGVKYSSTHLENVKITSKVPGFVTYPSGIFGEGMSCYLDRHFVVFDTDVKVDDLMAVKLKYTSQDYVETQYPILGVENKPSGDEETVTKWYYDDEQGGFDYKELFGFISFGGDRSWDIIQSGKELYEEMVAEDAEMSEELKKALTDDAWVINYLQTERNITTSIPITTYYTDVSEVLILQLYYETAGKTYNLGCVDNKMREPCEPSIILPPEPPQFFPDTDSGGIFGGGDDDKASWFEKLKDWWKGIGDSIGKAFETIQTVVLVITIAIGVVLVVWVVDKVIVWFKGRNNDDKRRRR